MNTAKEDGGREAVSLHVREGRGERLRGRVGAGARGRAPVVCRPIDKQRRYCKCIGTTRCGASLAAFLRDAERRAPAYVVYGIDGPIVRRSILSYRLSRRGETIVVTHRRCTARRSFPLPPSLLSLFSLFLFRYAKNRPLSISLSDQPRRRPASFMRSRPPFHPPPVPPPPLRPPPSPPLSGDDGLARRTTWNGE